MGGRAKCARLHQERDSPRRDPPQILGHVAIEFGMQPLDERGRGRAQQGALMVQAVDFGLHPHMGAGFQLQVALVLAGVEILGHGPLGLAQGGVVAFNAVGVEGVHGPHQIRQGDGGGLGQAVFQLPRSAERSAIKSATRSGMASIRHGSMRSTGSLS